MSNLKKLTVALGISAALALTATAAIAPASGSGVVRAERDCC